MVILLDCSTNVTVIVQLHFVVYWLSHPKHKWPDFKSSADKWNPVLCVRRHCSSEEQSSVVSPDAQRSQIPSQVFSLVFHTQGARVRVDFIPSSVEWKSCQVNMKWDTGLSWGFHLWNVPHWNSWLTSRGTTQSQRNHTAAKKGCFGSSDYVSLSLSHKAHHTCINKTKMKFTVGRHE